MNIETYVAKMECKKNSFQHSILMRSSSLRATGLAQPKKKYSK